MGDWRERLSGEERAGLAEAAMPDWTRPMLATLTDERFSSTDWICERQLHGERCRLFRDDKAPREVHREEPAP